MKYYFDVIWSHLLTIAHTSVVSMTDWSEKSYHKFHDNSVLGFIEFN